MRRRFITAYEQNLRLLPSPGARLAYGCLIGVALAAPLAFGPFGLSEASGVLIFAIAGLGLMLPTGYTGLVSFGHAAFVGVGAYAEAYLLNLGLPFVLSFPLAGLVSAAAGFAIGRPILRLTGIYLVMATYAFSLIVQEIFASWAAVTGGYSGIRVPPVAVFGFGIGSGPSFYYLCLGTLALIVLGVANLLRSRTGRALIAIRDSQVAAQTMGINLARFKTIAFTLSAGIAGLAGALLGHRLGYISPEAFDVNLSLQLLLIVVVGGLSSIHGAIFGATLVALLPQSIAILRTMLPPAVANQPGLEAGLFGLILMLVVLFEPTGMYGVWVKVKAYLAAFPLHRKATFRRQKIYMRSERH